MIRAQHLGRALINTIETVVSENANGAEISNPMDVLEIRGDPPTQHGLCDEPVQSCDLQKRRARTSGSTFCGAQPVERRLIEFGARG